METTTLHISQAEASLIFFASPTLNEVLVEVCTAHNEACAQSDVFVFVFGHKTFLLYNIRFTNVLFDFGMLYVLLYVLQVLMLF